MATEAPTKGRQRPATPPVAPRPPSGRGRAPAALKWLVDAPRLVRLRAEWAALSPEFREAVRLEALTQGRYLLQVLEAKGVRNKLTSPGKRVTLEMEGTK